MLTDDQNNILAELADMFAKLNGRAGVLEADNERLRGKADENTATSTSGPNFSGTAFAGLLTMVEDTFSKILEDDDKKILEDDDKKILEDDDKPARLTEIFRRFFQ